jgi:hypothetical protein
MTTRDKWILVGAFVVASLLMCWTYGLIFYAIFPDISNWLKTAAALLFGVIFGLALATVLRRVNWENRP